jgi:glucose/arabinose dehydrogenase
MRRVSIVFVVLAAALSTACTDPGQELAPATSAPPEPDTGATATPTTAPTPTTLAPDTTLGTEPPSTTTLRELRSLVYQEIARIDFPIQLLAWIPDIDIVATKDGRIYLYDGSRLSQDPVLDISGQVRNSGEQGLLSVAAHPEDTNRVFLHYSASDGDTVVSEFTWDNESLVDELVLLRLNQPAGNHNGGMLQFGPDGALYLGLGDGGGAADTYGNGQNTETLLGGLVRIDVNAPEPEAELHQYGLRNPWRFWIDQAEDDLIYVADVGQNAYEEVSVGALEPGINYGWPITEGLHCFRPSSGCDSTGIRLPVIEVEHGDGGTCSISGGIVYRGSAVPEIEGHYFYSDYCGGYLRSFRYEDGAAVEQTDWTAQVGTAGRVTSFGVDGDGEMYVLTTDRILKVVAAR